MMKKILSFSLTFLLFFVLSVSALSININKNNFTSAQSFTKDDEKVYFSIEKELTDLIENGISLENRQRSGRIPGSKAEYNTAIYLKNQLSSLTNFKPVNNSSTTDGIESFEFECIIDGNIYTSQNIIFKREAITQTNRKVVLATHYDVAYIQKEKQTYKEGGVVTEGVNESAASVATLLTLVKNLDKLPLDYGYDIEIVFFGANSNDYAGSEYYMRGHTEEMAKDILLMINLDKIGVGQHNYAYVNEFETQQEKYIFKTISGFKKLKQENTVDYSVKSPNGLEYTHIGLESDHAIFMKRNINTLSFFSGNYESFLTYGFKEFDNLKNITYTENDVYLYIRVNYVDFYTNLIKVYNAINDLMKDNNFISQMEKNNKLEGVYAFWTNEKLAVFISCIIFIVLLFVYFIIYKNLQDKSKVALESANFEEVVAKITKNIEEPDEELSDAINEKVKRDTDKNE